MCGLQSFCASVVGVGPNPALASKTVGGEVREWVGGWAKQQGAAATVTLAWGRRPLGWHAGCASGQRQCTTLRGIQSGIHPKRCCRRLLNAAKLDYVAAQQDEEVIGLRQCLLGGSAGGDQELHRHASQGSPAGGRVAAARVCAHVAPGDPSLA